MAVLLLAPLAPEEFDRALPDVRRLYKDLGFNFQHSKILGLVRHALRLDSRTLGYLAVGLAAYAVIEIIEGVGLWLLKRWGEYFAMVATSVFLPYEIYDLTVKFTVLRVLTFVVNLALVVYLVISKRLFGVRGGKRAYQEQLREDSILEAAEAAAAAAAESAAAAATGHPAGPPDSAERAAGRPLPGGDPDGSGDADPRSRTIRSRPTAAPRSSSVTRVPTSWSAAV